MQILTSRAPTPSAPTAISELEQLIIARRAAMVAEAAHVYGLTRSLRQTASQLKVSHEHVRALLSEAGIEANGKRGPRQKAVLQ